SRLNADRSEAEAAQASANMALNELPASLETETRLAAVRSDIDGHRRLAAQVRAEAQALAREAELADRRLQAILAERNQWQNRKAGAASQIETIEARVTEVKAERAELDNAPAIFAEKRRAAADALASAENVMAETDRAAKISLEALSAAREACARAEERLEGAKRRLADIEREIHDMLEVEPSAVAGLAEIAPGAVLPPLNEIEENLEKLRRDRERLGAVHL